MRKFDYCSDWSDYTYPETNDITYDSTIRSEFSKIDLSAHKYSASGMPILVRDNIAYVNNNTENMLIYGQTGSKKTRSGIAPTIVTTAGAGESAFVTDVKGELSSNPKIRRFLDDHGVKTVLIDFRTFDKDGFNLIEHAYALYKAGKKDKAMAECAVLINMLSAKYERSAKDPFWHGNAKQYLRPLIEMIFCMGIETGCDKKVNLLSISNLSNRTVSDTIAELFKKNPMAFRRRLMSNNFSSLRTVVDNPPTTMSNILSTAQTMLEEFTLQPDLTRMLSKTTFNVESMYEKPTCVFLIVPDETSAYDATAGILIDSFYNRLIETYSKRYMNKCAPKCRINFICDEFCNLSVNDMRAKISASRGREMRWFLVCQSKDQMEATYGSAAGTIIGNCQNTLFLQSCDENLLDHICRMCGTTEVSRSGSEPLVTPDMLKSLRKDQKYKEALFINEKIHYFAKLPDIDSYEFLNKYATSSGKRVRKNTAGKFDDIDRFDINDIKYVFEEHRLHINKPLVSDDDDDEEDIPDEADLYVDFDVDNPDDVIFDDDDEPDEDDTDDDDDSN